MRNLYLRLSGDRGSVVQAYAAAERRGDVERRSNKHRIGADDYANRLFDDGIRKGWLR